MIPPETHPAHGTHVRCRGQLGGLLRFYRGGAKESKQGPAEPPPTVIVAEVPPCTVHTTSDFVAQTEAVPTVEIRV